MNVLAELDKKICKRTPVLLKNIFTLNYLFPKFNSLRLPSLPQTRTFSSWRLRALAYLSGNRLSDAILALITVGINVLQKSAFSYKKI